MSTKHTPELVHSEDVCDVRECTGRKVARFNTGEENEWKPRDRRKGDEEFARRCVSAYNATYAANLNPSAIAGAVKAFNRLSDAVGAIHKPLGDETETCGNPCTSPSPEQGREIGSALIEARAALAELKGEG